MVYMLSIEGDNNTDAECEYRWIIYIRGSDVINTFSTRLWISTISLSNCLILKTFCWCLRNFEWLIMDVVNTSWSSLCICSMSQSDWLILKRFAYDLHNVDHITWSQKRNKYVFDWNQSDCLVWISSPDPKNVINTFLIGTNQIA